MTTPPLDPPPSARAVLDRLRAAGHESYFVGGCVRDALLGHPPKDWDIATAAAPDAVEALFEKTVPVGKAFGVMIVVRDGASFEVATFRADREYRDGRRPEGVRFTSAEEDVKRRDFTMNALLYDPADGRVLDFVGGEADIRARRLRTVGDPETRFREDHLRLLRAVRFAARTGFDLDPETGRALDELAGLVRTVSPERVGAELLRMLTEGTSRPAFRLLAQTGLLVHVLPDLVPMQGMPQPPQFHPEGDVWEHTLLMLGRMDAGFASPPPEGDADAAPAPDLDPATWNGFAREVLGWAALLHDVGKPPTLSVSDRIRFHEHDAEGARMAETILEGLKRPRRVIEAVRDLIGRHIHFANLQRMRKAKLRRWLREPLFPVHLELHRLDCASSHRMLQTHAFGAAAWREEADRPPEPKALLTGKDLIAMGYAPGPGMGAILDAVEDARLEGILSTPEGARAWVDARYDA